MTRHTNTTSYEIGGVMRCCIESLQKWAAANPTVEDGQEVLCQYESDNQDSGFVLRGNQWKVRLFDATIQSGRVQK